MFIRVGLDRTLVRDLIHYPERFSDLVQASLFLRYILTFLILSGLLIWKLIFIQSSITWGVFFIITATAILSLDLQPVYDALNNIKRHTVYFLLQKFFYLTLIWVGVVLFQNYFSIFWIGISLLISMLLYLFVQHQWVMRCSQIKESNYHELAGSITWLLRHNWLIWFTAIAGLAIAMLNQIILKKYCGYAELGGYAAAWQLVMVGTLLLDQLSRIGRPATARITKPEVLKDVQIRFVIKYFAIMIGVVTPLVLIMFFFPGHIFKLLFRPEYYSAAATLPVMGVYLIFFAVGMVSSQYALSARLERMYFYAVITGGVLSIAFCFMLIPSYGAIGAAWALLISHGMTIIIYSIGMARHILK